MLSQQIYALLLVFIAAIPVFLLAKPIFSTHITEALFKTRRNIWFGIVAAAFIAPSFWIYSLFAGLILTISRKHETNPVALFLLLAYSVPATRVELPALAGIPLFPIGHIEIIAALILIPGAITKKKSRDDPAFKWVLIFCAVQILLWMDSETITHTLRRTVSLLTSTAAIYFGLSKNTQTKSQLKDAIIFFALGLVLISSAAIVEGAKNWLLYENINNAWGRSASAFATRQGGLRASATTESSLILGHLAGCAFILVLAIIKNARGISILQRTLLCAVPLGALYFARSRGPLISTAIGLLVFLVLSSESNRALFKTILLAVAASGLLLLSPLGNDIIDFLPFIGTLDADTVTYRTQMSKALWALTASSPLTGNPLFLRELGFLRQGEGIIDLLNVYATFGAGFGLPGLISLAACVGLSARYAQLATKKEDSAIPNANKPLYAALAGSASGHAVFLYSASFAPSISNMTMILLALATSAVVLGGTERHERRAYS